MTVFDIFDKYCIYDDDEWNINDAYCDNKKCDFITNDMKYLQFYAN